MLKIDKKTKVVTISGKSDELLTEMTTLIHTLYERFIEAYEDEDFAKMIFEHCFELSLIRDDEIRERVAEEIWDRMVGDDE